MRSARSSLDLLAAIALALAGLAAALIPLDVWLRSVLWAPLVLCVCGYAILAALFPERAPSLDERAVYAVTLSVAATALGGIVVQLVLGLDRAVWATLLVAITVAAALVAIWRRDRLPPADRTAPEPPRALPRLSLPGPLASLALIAAVLAAAAAVVISSNGARHERDSYRFTALWLQPTRHAATTGGAVTVGIENHQGAAARYRLVVKQGAGSSRGAGSGSLTAGVGACSWPSLRSGRRTRSLRPCVATARSTAMFISRPPRRHDPRSTSGPGGPPRRAAGCL
jgi:uncharacterized membrane protein